MIATGNFRHKKGAAPKERGDSGNGSKYLKCQVSARLAISLLTLRPKLVSGLLQE